jgi:hypothetical protein
MLFTVIVLLVAAASAAAAAFWVYHRTAGSFPQSPTLPDLQIAKVTKSGNVVHVDISPDGRYLVYAVCADKGVGLRVRQVGTASDLEILPPDFGLLRGITFTPDGNYILFVHGNSLLDSNLYSMPVFGGTPQLLIRQVDSRASFSPNGRQIMFVRKDVKHNTAQVTVANSDDYRGSGWRLAGGRVVVTRWPYGGGIHQSLGQVRRMGIGHNLNRGWQRPFSLLEPRRDRSSSLA